MLYHIACYLKPHFSALNVIHYISFRAMAALLSSLAFSLWFGPWFISLSQRLFRAKVRPFTPESHQAKNDMPTMGGIFIIGIVLLTVLLWCNLAQPQIWIALACLISFAAIGLLDDVAKLTDSKGISSRTKFSLQIIVSAVIACAWIYFVDPSTQLSFPFFKHIHPDLGWWFIPWVMFVLIGTSNAVNLTDGLDGLAIGSLISNFATFALICYIAGHGLISHYLNIPFAGTGEMAIVGTSLVGASLGFLWYNTYPAQIFMGDVGSLGLGSVLAFMALASKQELLLPIAGGLFVIETLSVIVQVLSFKFLGRRMFRMAPIHHHFELQGWQESKITVRFCIISFVLCLIALMTIKLR
ncbi:MAG: phospho-N-acetylmuramoyl-pentapeptide-transferase [Alteromonas naphthalenivorans]|jgi:phospho-N-acetylmuramoyl-pentapeptide-transferase